MKSLRFQKMNIVGSDILTRLQMKKVVGGHANSCTHTYTNANGDTSTFTTSYEGTCSQQSGHANSTCVNILEDRNTSGDRCQYDCSCDGVGR